MQVRDKLATRAKDAPNVAKWEHLHGWGLGSVGGERSKIPQRVRAEAGRQSVL